MAVSQEPGASSSWLAPIVQRGSRCSYGDGAVSVVRIEWVTASAVWRGRRRLTVVGSCKGRADCTGSVFRQLAPRWANDGPAGQLSRSQWVWLWDIPEVLVWTAWNPQGKQRPPSPRVSPTVPSTGASTARATRHGFKRVFVCLMFGGFNSHEKNQYIQRWWGQKVYFSVTV